ncbi:MAG: hypothetical protein QOH64_2562 [Acidimicrobiaceae bacterium]|jgi:uncharacterized protein YicC (UPF0701 family)
MSDQHKAALAEGRSQGRAVRNYLEALEATKPKRGRKRTPDSIKKRLEAIDAALADADKLTELKLRQERVNLERELEAGSVAIDLTSLERDFAAVASKYGQRQGITYQVWRDTGVPAAVLKKAGISRGSG